MADSPKHKGARATALYRIAAYPFAAVRTLVEMPVCLAAAMGYAAIRRNPDQAKRCVDALRGKAASLAGSTEARTIVFLFALAFCVRVATSLATVCVSKDAATFLSIARHIQDKGLASAVETNQHPLFPLLMAGFQMLFGRTILGAQLFCSFLSALAVAPFYLLVRDVFGNPVARLAGAIFAVHGVVVCNAADILTEPAYMLFYLASLGFGLRALRKPSWTRFFMAGLLSGLAYLTRPEGLGAAMIVGGWAGLFGLARIKGGWKPFLVGGAVLAAGAAICVLPYAGMNGWRLTPKKKMAELVRFEENPSRQPYEAVKPKPPVEAARYNLHRMGELVVVLVRTGHAWLVMLPFGLLLRRTVGWGGFGEIYLLSAIAFNLLLGYAVNVVFGYVSQRHLLTAAALMMPWMAIGVEETLAGLASAGGVRRVVATLGGAALLALAASVITEDFLPRRRDQEGTRRAGLWIARHMPDRTICGTLAPRVALYAHAEYIEMRSDYPLFDVADIARKKGAGIIVVDAENVRRTTPDYDLNRILKHPDLRERFSCENRKGTGGRDIIVFEVLPREGHD
ncbi:MAG: glycosyltransferase family 39 protein [Planctomycetota bacterium]